MWPEVQLECLWEAGALPSSLRFPPLLLPSVALGGGRGVGRSRAWLLLAISLKKEAALARSSLQRLSDAGLDHNSGFEFGRRIPFLHSKTHLNSISQKRHIP